MSTELSERVMLHITDAQSWLSRASHHYQASNRIRGELDLSLAQAEVEYAWELSRGRATIAPAKAKRWTSRWGLPIAACLGICLLAVAVLPRLADHSGLVSSDRGRAGQAMSQPHRAQVATNEPAGKAGVADASLAEWDKTRSSGQRAASHVSPPAKRPVRQVTASPAEGLPQAASAEGGLAVDLGELERVAHETLTSGAIAIDGQR